MDDKIRLWKKMVKCAKESRKSMAVFSGQIKNDFQFVKSNREEWVSRKMAAMYQLPKNC